MLYYLITFVFILHLPTSTLAVECFTCSHDVQFNAVNAFNMTGIQCEKTMQPGQMCMASLYARLEYGNATMLFSHIPAEILILFNGNKFLSNSTSMWFNKNITLYTAQINCIDSDGCVEDIKEAYSKVKEINYAPLRTKLREILHTDRTHVADLTCSNGQGQAVSCGNGFCQLIRSGLSKVDRRCIPQGEGLNPSGIVIGTNTMESSDAEPNIIYACNKPMCNGAETDLKVRQLLIQYKMITSSNLAPSETTTSVTTRTTMRTGSPITTSQRSSVVTISGTNSIAPSTTTKNTATTNMNYQWMLLLILTVLFKN